MVVAEGVVGAHVGELQTFDEDAVQWHSYTIVDTLETDGVGDKEWRFGRPQCPSNAVQCRSKLLLLGVCCWTGVVLVLCAVGPVWC
jgi:hypothetical protein